MNTEAFRRNPRAQRGLVGVVAAQFISSLADNALLIVAIGLLLERDAAAWMTPALRLVFYLSYVLLAPFAGAIADAVPKSRVMLITNLVKLGGCLLLLTALHPLLSYALIGCGAAAYSPAKYGILPELLPPEKLVAANAWIEISTVASILPGVVLGSFLLDGGNQVPHWMEGHAVNASALLAVLYAVAALCTTAIPYRAASNPVACARPAALIGDFRQSLLVLLRDPQAQVSLAVTSLFWSVAAALQFIVLRWAMESYQLTLAEAGLLQGAVALGMVAGAVFAARWVSVRRALHVLPLGVALGVVLLLMPWVTSVAIAALLLGLIGLLAGVFLVPMNALLQLRGQALMHTGQSVSIQNFYENLASILILGAYGFLLSVEVPILPIIVGLGLAIVVAMTAIIGRNKNLS